MTKTEFKRGIFHVHYCNNLGSNNMEMLDFEVNKERECKYFEHLYY